MSQIKLADLRQIASEFSTSTSYAVGDYCIQSGLLQRCTAPHSAGAWNSAHFTQVDAASELKLKASAAEVTDLKEDFTKLETSIDNIYNDNHLPFTVVEGKIIGPTGAYTNNANARTLLIPVLNQGMIAVRNCNRRSFSDDTVVAFDVNGDVVASGVTYKKADLQYLSVIIPASGVTKIAIPMWNVGYTSGTYVINAEPFVTQLATESTSTNLMLGTEFPFSKNIYNKAFVYRSILLINGTSMSSNSALGTYGYIPVEEGDVLAITFPNTSYTYSALTFFIQYFNSSFTYISNAVYGTGSFTVPSGAKYCAFYMAVADIDNCVIKKTSAAVPDIKIDPRAITTSTTEDKRAYPLYVTIADSVINMTYKYNASHDMTVQMCKQGGLDGNDQPTGGNQLFDFCRWFLTENTAFSVTETPNTTTEFKINGTDFLGPYRVRAIDNIDGDSTNNNDFTGGNHQYNNSGSGSTATARTTDIKFQVDGKYVTSYAGYARDVKISWTNYVQANNTKKSDGTGREVLTEKYEVWFDGDKFKVRNIITALEEIKIYTYYGMQAKQMYNTTGATTNYFIYAGSKANKGWQPRSTATASGDKYSRDIIYQKNADRLEMHMDAEGLGDFADAITNPNTDVACSAISSTGKLYFNLIDYGATYDGTGLALDENESVFWSGYYRFCSLY